MQKLIFSLVIIVTGLLFGYIGQKLVRKTDYIHENSILFVRKFLQKLGMLFFMPVSFVAAVWVISFEDIRVAFLPLIGAGTLLLGGGTWSCCSIFYKER